MTQVSFKLPWGKLRGLSMGNRSSNNIYICIHGWQDNSALFRPLIEKLPQENHYISLDMIDMVCISTFIYLYYKFKAAVRQTKYY